MFLKVLVLRHFDSTRSLRIKTNVFDKTLNDILLQQDDEDHWHSIAYYFKKLILAKCNYEVHDKKLLTIVDSFKQWRHYLEKVKHDILILIDHHNLKQFMKTTRLLSRQVRWVQELSKYHFIIDYKSDSKNSADELFKRSDYMTSISKKIECNRQILH